MFFILIFDVLPNFLQSVLKIIELKNPIESFITWNALKESANLLDLYAGTS